MTITAVTPGTPSSISPGSDQRKQSSAAFLQAAVAYFAKLGVRIERVMTDNGSCYQSKIFRAACKRLGLRQVSSRFYPKDLEFEAR